jgi:integrase/recombinase XerD
MPIDEVKATDFYNWIYSLQAKGTSHNSINHYLRDCRAFLYWCMKEERQYISKPFKVQMVKGQEEPLKFYSEEEVHKLLAKPDINDTFTTWRTWVMVNWVMGTGNRSSTMCEIKLEDINFSTKEVKLRHTKTKEAQITRLTPALEKAVKEYISIFEIEDWLFPDNEGYKLNTNALRHSFQKYCKKRGVTHTNIHGLRHSFAREWIKGGGGQAQLQQILGHKTPEQTMHYAKLFGEDIAKDFNTFNPLNNYQQQEEKQQPPQHKPIRRR